MTRPISIAVVGLIVMFLQLCVLPPDGFFCGDQGAKYLQALAVAEHGPSAPGIDVMSHDIDAGFLHTDPLLAVHNGRLLSVFSWAFALLTAPFLRLFGVRGLYVLPALGAIGIFAAAWTLGERLCEGAGRRAAWITLLGTPAIFYGLEFWEHTPAAACVMFAAVLAAPGGSGRANRLIAAGILLGLAALFRDEALVALLAMMIAQAAVCCGPRGAARALRGAAAIGAGALLVAACAVPVQLFLYGSTLPVHLTIPAARAVQRGAVLRLVVHEWLMPTDFGGMYVATIVAAAGVAVAAMFLSRASRALLLAMHALMVVLVALCVGVPLWRQLESATPASHLLINPVSAAHTWLFWLPLLYLPFVEPGLPRRDVATFLLVTAALTLAGIVLTTPTAAGAQWSPRLLLIAAPLLAVVASLAGAPSRRTVPAPAAFIPIAATALFGLAILVQLGAVDYLRHTKRVNLAIVDAIRAGTRDGDVVISNVFWVPELSAPLQQSRRFLFARGADELPQLALSAVRSGFVSVVVVTDADAPTVSATRVAGTGEAGCALALTQSLVTERQLKVERWSCGVPRAHR